MKKKNENGLEKIALRQKKENDFLSPEQLIQEALEIGKKVSEDLSNPKNILSSANEKVMETVYNTKEISRQLFVSNLSNRKVNEAKNIFIHLLDEVNQKADKVLQINKAQIRRIKTEINCVNQQNFGLEDELTSVNNNCRRIDMDLKKTSEIINQLQTKFILFEKVKPLFEELIKEFPNEDPVQIIHEIQSSKEKNISTIYLLNSLADKIEEREKEKSDLITKNEKNENELLEKINEINIDLKVQKDKYNKDITELTEELNTYKTYAKENNKINNLLYNLYMDIISKIQKDKLYDAEKKYGKFKTNKEEFNAEIFDNNNFISLINDTLLKNNRGKSSVLLRQTVAYANLMVRKFLKNNGVLRFDLIGTFKEIKNLIDKKEFDNYKLKCIITNLKQGAQKNKQTIKELKNEVKLRKLKYNSLINKVNRQLKVENKSGLGSKKDLKRLDTVEKPKRAKTTKGRKFFITSKDIAKSVNAHAAQNKSILSAPNESSISDSEDAAAKSHHEEQKVGDSNKVNEKDIKKFKDLKLSKNKDKLIKSNGFKGVESFIWGLKNLVESTNRIYYYQKKIDNALPRNQRPTTSDKVTTNFETHSSEKKPSETVGDIMTKNILKKLDGIIDQVKNSPN